MSTEVLEKIKSRGHWWIIIRPDLYIEERIPTLAGCQELIAKHQLRYRSWYFPHLDAQGLHRGLRYIEQATALGSIKETWRFYQSAQFAFARGLAEDWIEDEVWPPGQQGPSITPGTKLGILSALHHLSEIYEFTARLAQTGIFDNKLFLSVNLVSTEGREVFFWGGDRHLRPGHICSVPELLREKTYNATDFIARSREYSFEHFLWLVERFGFDASPEIFKRDQENFFHGRF
jgi:hypothetical protein